MRPSSVICCVIAGWVTGSAGCLLGKRDCPPPPRARPPPAPPCGKYVKDGQLDSTIDQKDCPPPPPKPVPPPPPPSPPSSPSSSPPCVDSRKKCKESKCKNYRPAKLQKCKKTCGLCEPLPPSAPPPPALPEADCGSCLLRAVCNKNCKIKPGKNCKMKKCRNKCKKDRKKKKPRCQRTCCQLGFPV